MPTLEMKHQFGSGKKMRPRNEWQAKPCKTSNGRGPLRQKRNPGEWKENEDQPLKVGWIEPRQWDDDLAKASTSVFPKLPITLRAIPNEPLVMTEGSPENTLHWSLWILCSKKMCKLFPMYPTFPFSTGLLLFYADFNRFWFYCNCVFILFF